MNQLMSDGVYLSFLLRVVLGILFFFQGYDKVFRIRMEHVLETSRREMSDLHLPLWLVKAGAYFTSYTELIGGAMLLLGFGTSAALWLLGLDLIVVTAAFTLMNPAWNMQMVAPRLLLLGVLLYLPRDWDLISIDNLLQQIIR